MTKAFCPICARQAVREEDPLFPFCSRRCKLADLGRWLGGEYRIPVRHVEEDEDGMPHLPQEGADS